MNGITQIIRREAMDYTEEKIILAPEQALSIAKIYSGDNNVSIRLSDEAKTFAINLRTKEIIIPNQIIQVGSIEDYAMGIRHESYHLKYSEFEKFSNKLKFHIWNNLEDLRLDKRAERDNVGGKRLNDFVYTLPLYNLTYKKANPFSGLPELKYWIYSLKYSGMYPRKNVGFKLPTRVIEIQNHIRTSFPEHRVLMEYVEEVYEICEKLYKDAFDSGELGNPPEFETGGDQGDQEASQGDQEASQGDQEASQGDQGGSQEDPGGSQGDQEQQETSNSGSGISKQKTGSQDENGNPEKRGSINPKFDDVVDYAFDQLKQLEAEDEKRSIQNRIEIVYETNFVGEKAKQALLDFVRAYTNQPTPIQGDLLNKHVTDLGVGLLSGDLDLIFHTEIPERKKERGKIIFALDVSGSMGNYAIWNKNLREKYNERGIYSRHVIDLGGIQGKDFAPLYDVGLHSIFEVCELECFDLGIEIILWDSFACVSKEAGIKFKNWREFKTYIKKHRKTEDNNLVWLGGTEPLQAIELLYKRKPDKEETLIIIFTDGQWNYSEMREYSKFKTDYPNTALILIAETESDRDNLASQFEYGIQENLLDNIAVLSSGKSALGDAIVKVLTKLQKEKRG
jgi:hypothetical protein